MTFRRNALAALACAALASSAYAQQQLKPGLWEMSNHFSDSSGQMTRAMAEMQKQLAQMAPEQRKMMEDMLAKRGVQINSASDGGMLMKMCLTPEMVKNNALPTGQSGNCTQTHSPVSGGKMTFSFSCPDRKTSGDGDITFKGETSYAMKVRVVQGANGAPTSMESTARWLGADCGDIKPLAMPK